MKEQRLLSTYDVHDYEVITEVSDKPTGPVKKIMMKGILQKADTLNQNGRIYPKYVLEREVRNYQKFILENRALGELDHPDSCVPTGTEIFTKHGWKKIEDISDDEIVATINPNSEEIQFQRITGLIDQPYEGEMIHFSNARTYDVTVTPNHRVLTWDRAGKSKFLLASELYDLAIKGDSSLSHSGLKCVGQWIGEEPEKFEGISLDLRFMKIEKKPYSGRIHCVVTPNQTWLMRQNGKTCWTGNSVVNLKNVSHIVREAYMEDGTVYGTVEILDTPSGKVLQSLVESKVKLGISSRGVGSTAKKGDYYEVQDDFQLICWDYVSEPSTPGAFMIPEGKKITQAELNKVFNKSDRIDRILNEILKKLCQLGL